MKTENLNKDTEMQESNSVVVINDTEGIWSGSEDVHERFSSYEHSVDGRTLYLGVWCDEEYLLYSDVFNFLKGSILLALKSDQSGVQLAYEFHVMYEWPTKGWNRTDLSCKDPQSLQDAGEMTLRVVLKNHCFEFEREETLPEEFAFALRRALKENNVSDDHSNECFNPDDMDTFAVVNDPDIACVIPDRLPNDEISLLRSTIRTADLLSSP